MIHTQESYFAQVLSKVQNGDYFEVEAKILELESMGIPIERAIKILNK
tara:strand:- start:19 stop:162 length:144 start_codon:yes stop_codon:yes gene_type:complete